MTTFDNKGRGALWSNGHWAEGSSAPKWTGKLTADRDIKAGEEIKLAVWPGDRKSEKSPVMRLQIDRFEKKPKEDAPAPSGAPKEGEPFDDEIPF